jgi:hypothetical protein
MYRNEGRLYGTGRGGQQCCGSGMFIPDPDFFAFRMPDLKSRIQDPTTKKGERKISRHVKAQIRT